jgi:hypothetical protein
MKFEKLLRAEAKKLFAPYEKRFSELDQPGRFPDVIDTKVLIDSPEVELYRGTLKIPRLVRRKMDPALIVLGDLDVAELLEIHPQAGAVSVLGHIHAGSILSPDELFCSKNIQATRWVYGRSSNRGLMLLGAIKTPLLVCDGGYIVGAADGIDADLYIVTEGGLVELQQLIPVKFGRYETTLSVLNVPNEFDNPEDIRNALDAWWKTSRPC